MSKLINISTTELKKDNASFKTHDFNIQIDNLYLEPAKRYSIALYNYSMWYSWFNITASNNQFRYYNGTTLKIITIPNGNYGVSDLNLAIKNGILTAGDEPNNIAFSSNFNTLRVEVVLLNNYQVDFRDANSNNFRVLFGFNDALITTSSSGSLVPNITNSIDNVNIGCSLVSTQDNFINNKNNNFIYSFVPSTGVGTNLSANGGIQNPLFLPISIKGYVGKFNISVRDNNGNLIDLNNENVSITLVIKEEKD